MSRRRPRSRSRRPLASRRRGFVALTLALVLAAGGAYVALTGHGSGVPASSASTSSDGRGPTATAGPGVARVDRTRFPLVAASVNGAVLSGAALADELDAVGSVPAYLSVLDSQLADNGTTTRAAGGGFDAGFVRTVLRRRIVFLLVEAELTSRKLAVDPACEASATAQLPTDLAGGDTPEGRTFLAALPTAYRADLLRWNAELRTLQQSLSGVRCTAGNDPAVGRTYAAWLDGRLASARITVDPALGHWDPATATVRA